MKRLLILLCLLLAVAEDISRASGPDDLITKVAKEVKQGNWAALDDLKDMPAEEAMPIYGRIAREYLRDPSAFERIGKLVRARKDALPYLARKMEWYENIKACDDDLGNIVILLQAIRTNAAVLQLGAYMDRSVYLSSGASDVSGDRTDLIAVGTLHDMKLPGAPYFGPSGQFDDKEFERFKGWWKENRHQFTGDPDTVVPTAAQIQVSSSPSSQRLPGN